MVRFHYYSTMKTFIYKLITNFKFCFFKTLKVPFIAILLFYGIPLVMHKWLVYPAVSPFLNLTNALFENQVNLTSNWMFKLEDLLRLHFDFSNRIIKEDWDTLRTMHGLIYDPMIQQAKLKVIQTFNLSIEELNSPLGESSSIYAYAAKTTLVETVQAWRNQFYISPSSLHSIKEYFKEVDSAEEKLFYEMNKNKKGFFSILDTVILENQQQFLFYQDREHVTVKEAFQKSLQPTRLVNIILSGGVFATTAFFLLLSSTNIT